MNPPANQSPLLGRACLAAYKRVLDECLRFKASELYLTRIQVGAIQGDPTSKEAHDAFMSSLEPEYKSPTDYFLERSFIQLVASFEFFLQELVHTIVVVYPKKVGKVEFKLSEILDAGSSDELIRRSIAATLNSIMYKKPLDYLKEVADLLSIDHTPFQSKWALFVEAKARRDLGVHNGWKCNETYVRKVTEAGLDSQYSLGQRVFPAPDRYFDQVRETLSGLASSMVDTVLAKHRDALSRALP